MLSSVVLTAALLASSAPAPKPPAGAGATVVSSASGVAPRLLELKPDADGKIRVNVIRPGNGGGIGVGGANIAPGQARPARAVRRVGQRVELAEVKDLVITTVGGKSVSTADALKELATGGIVIVPADGKKVPAQFLKAFKDDVLILASPELMGGGFFPIQPPVPNGGPAGVILPGGQGGQIQIRIQAGGGGGILPLQPIPANVPEN